MKNEVPEANGLDSTPLFEHIEAGIYRYTPQRQLLRTDHHQWETHLALAEDQEPEICPRTTPPTLDWNEQALPSHTDQLSAQSRTTPSRRRRKRR